MTSFTIPDQDFLVLKDKVVIITGKAQTLEKYCNVLT